MNSIFYIFVAVLIVILLICLSIASYAGASMFEQYKIYNKKMSGSFTTASNFIALANATYLNNKIKIAQKEGTLTDAYHPSIKVIYLSKENFGNSSVAALSIAAHELGHAMQDYENGNILNRRDRLSFIAKIFGFLLMPLFIAGIILFFVYPDSIIYSLLCLGGALVIFVLALIVKLVTISIEKDASKRAIKILKDLNMLDEDELKDAKKLLQAALLTYIADFLRAILGWTMLTKNPNFFKNKP